MAGKRQTLKQRMDLWAQIIAGREGQKSQAMIYNITEQLGIEADLLHEDRDFLTFMIDLGNYRAKRKAKKNAPAAD